MYEILRNNGFKGKLYNAITSIYCCVKACVRDGNDISSSLACPIGLRQGCKLSPILFAMYINELHTFLENQNTRGVQHFPDITEIFMLMFADDVGLFFYYNVD